MSAAMASAACPVTTSFPAQHCILVPEGTKGIPERSITKKNKAVHHTCCHNCLGQRAGPARSDESDNVEIAKRSGGYSNRDPLSKSAPNCFVWRTTSREGEF